MAAGGGKPNRTLSTAVMKARGGFGGATRGNGGRAAPKHSTPDMRYGGRKCAPPGDTGIARMVAGGTGSGIGSSRAVINKVARSTPDWPLAKILKMTPIA
jgi:hypothetical protein